MFVRVNRTTYELVASRMDVSVDIYIYVYTCIYRHLPHAFSKFGDSRVLGSKVQCSKNGRGDVCGMKMMLSRGHPHKGPLRPLRKDPIHICVHIYLSVALSLFSLSLSLSLSL